jgi:hypothetical protein
MAQRRKSIRHKSLRRNNRTTLKRGGMEKTNKPVKTEKTSQKNEQVHYPRTNEQWEAEFIRLHSPSFKQYLNERAQIKSKSNK